MDQIIMKKNFFWASDFGWKKEKKSLVRGLLSTDITHNLIRIFFAQNIISFRLVGEI